MDEERKVVDEQEFLDNLVDDGPVGSHEPGRQFQYTRQVGCLNFRSVLINVAVYAVVLMVTSGLFPGGFYISGLAAAIEAAFVMAALNLILKPILVVLTLPLTLVTFGLFYVVINGIILWVASAMMGDAFVISSFLTAVVASVFISLLRLAINRYILKENNIRIS